MSTIIYNIAESIGNRKFNALAAPLPKIFYFGKEDNDINHFVQSEYANQFFKLNGAPDIDWKPIENMTPEQGKNFWCERKFISTLAITPAKTEFFAWRQFPVVS